MSNTGAGRNRIYIPPEAVAGELITLEGDELYRLRHVLRLGRGESFKATDGTGREYSARIRRIDRRHAEAEILAVAEIDREPPVRVVLAQAVPRGNRMAGIIRRAVELGVAEIQPLVAERSVVTVAGERSRARRRRWEEIARSAVGQSGRTRVPRIRDAVPWEAFLAEPVEGLKIILWEKSLVQPEKVLAVGRPPGRILIAVGPEGGWTDGEVEAALARGFRDMRLGPRILRTETAGAAAASILLHRFGDM